MENRPWQRHYDYNGPTTVRYPRLPAHEMLNLPAATFPDKPATDFYGTQITFHELRWRVLKMANALGALGVSKGVRVGVHLPTSPQDVIAYFAIVDRKKDMIIAGGCNIYPREIDEVLFQHPKIKDAVSVGVADAYRGETVKAYVVLREGQSVTAEEIIGFCREKLAAYKAPDQVEFRRDLPKSAVGKVLRKVLRDQEATKGKHM
jgi:acyl-CoA synthetase (AMP-forming)/AMP-acid ligase II